jgi:hypothetical protein
MPLCAGLELLGQVCPLHLYSGHAQRSRCRQDNKRNELPDLLRKRDHSYGKCESLPLQGGQEW